MRTDLRDVQQALHFTALYVTHDQVEACALSDRIVVMQNGRIVQVGAPQEIFARPESLFVAEFFGAANSVTGRVESVAGNTLHVAVDNNEGELVRSTNWDPALTVGARCTIILRSSHLSVLPVTERDPVEPPGLSTRGRIKTATFLGDEWELAIDTLGQTMLVRHIGDSLGIPGDDVKISVRTDWIRVIGNSTSVDPGEEGLVR